MTSVSTTIRPAAAGDAAAICAIYNRYVSATTISFEEEPVTANEMAQRIADVHAAALTWLAVLNSEVGRKFGRWVDVGYWQLKLGELTPPADGSTA